MVITGSLLISLNLEITGIFNAVKPLETAKDVTEAYRLPADVTGTSVYRIEEDPCTKVTAYGGGWRLPTQKEVVDSAGKNVYTFPGYYNGVKGILSEQIRNLLPQIMISIYSYR